MRTTPSKLRCIARYSHLAPSNHSLKIIGEPSRIPARRPSSHNHSPTRFSHIATSLSWWPPGTTYKTADVGLQDHQEGPGTTYKAADFGLQEPQEGPGLASKPQEDHSPTNKPRWSFFSGDYRRGRYGKWQWLNEDKEQLAYQADILAPDSGYSRYVDWPKHENDLHLWACILDFRAQVDGPAGVAQVLEGLMRRQNLHVVEGKLAETFWGKILDAALDDEAESMLSSVWLYAEWLYHSHGAQWPNLYLTTLSSLVRKKLKNRAIVWHVRLCPDFCKDRSTFVTLMRQFVADQNRARQRIMRDLHFLSMHRGLYDELIPHVYSQGSFRLASDWRDLLISRGDYPVTDAARPFLQFRSAYFESKPLTAAEIEVAGLSNGQLREKSPVSVSESVNDGFDLRYFVNKVHGETFGIEEKTYDDNMGARLLASSWIPIDSAIDTICMLGFNTIGPLSLQSIALREQDADQITRRIKQLTRSGISIGDSSYARALEHFAATGSQALLNHLLQSDMHPDVFDDISTQRKILDSVRVTGNWEQHELIMAVRLAISQLSAEAVANDLLRAFLSLDKRAAVIDIADGMRARNYELSEHASTLIADHILKNVSVHTGGDPLQKSLTLFHTALCRRLLTTEFPLPSLALQKILFRAGRVGLLEDLEALAMQTIQRYHDTMYSEQHTMVNVHKHDLPAYALRLQATGAEHSNYLPIPHDLELSNPYHPVRRLFDDKLQMSIIRWGFRGGYYLGAKMDRPHVLELMEPKHFHFARGIRLLAMLRDRGLVIDPVRAARLTMLRIAELYWSGRLEALYGIKMANRGIKGFRARTDYVLGETAYTCNEAWMTTTASNGKSNVKPLLDVDVLRERVKVWGKRWRKKRPSIFARRIRYTHGEDRPVGRGERRSYYKRKDGGFRWYFGHLANSYHK